MRRIKPDNPAPSRPTLTFDPLISTQPTPSPTPERTLNDPLQVIQTMLDGQALVVSDEDSMIV
jgi:hypothetical protein